MSLEFLAYVAAGFAAQLIDGALGMAYGVSASSILLSLGLPPATVSATVHVSECFTSGASALSHRAFGNIDGTLFRRLLVPGMLGAILGAYVLVQISADFLRPIIASYLILMGLIIILKAFREFPPRRVTTHLRPLGFFGGLIDAMGGGGWGPIVASTLIVRGNDIRFTIGSVNAVEFFVTVSASATFLITLGVSNWQIIVGLATGGLLAAPIGAWVCQRIRVKPFMIGVGVLVILISLRTLLRHFGLLG